MDAVTFYLAAVRFDLEAVTFDLECVRLDLELVTFDLEAVTFDLELVRFDLEAVTIYYFIEIQLFIKSTYAKINDTFCRYSLTISHFVAMATLGFCDMNFGRAGAQVKFIFTFFI